FADTSLMLDIAMLARRLRSSRAELRARGAQPQVRALIERVGLHRLQGALGEPLPVPGSAVPGSRLGGQMIPVLLLLFILVPLLELYVILQVGEAIGVLPTIAPLIVHAV